MRRPTRVLLAAGALVTMGTACASLLGVEDVAYRADAGGGPSPAPPFDASPYVLQHLDIPPSALASDGFSLYWASGAQIFRSDGGPDGAQIFVDASSPISQVAATGSYVVWATQTKVQSEPTGDGPVVEIWPYTRAFTAVLDQVYWPGGQNSAQIIHCSATSACDGTRNVGNFYMRARGMVGEPSALYFFADTDAGTAVFACGLPAGCPGDSALSVSGLQAPSALAFDDMSLFWVEKDSVVTTPKPNALDASAPATVASGEAQPLAVASDGTYAYWTSSQGVRAKRLDGGAPVTLVPALGGAPTAILPFADLLVWLDPANKNVVAVVRPK